DLTRTCCARVGFAASRQIAIIVGLHWRKRRISRKWIIPRPRGGWRGEVLRNALARHRSHANQNTRDDHGRAESDPPPPHTSLRLPPHTSIGVQRGAFKDAAVKSLTSLSVGCWLPLAPLGSDDHNL